MNRVAYFIQVGIILYAIFGAWLFLNQRNEIFHPDPNPVRTEELPGFETRQFTTYDNLTLTGWLHQGSPMIVYFQGNAGNAGDRYPDVKPFVDKGWGVFLVPYRGYGGNPGKPTEKYLYEDSERSLELLNHHSPHCTIVFGRSLGSGVASYIARKYRAAALVLHSPFLSVSDVAAEYYPIYPVEWLIKDKFDSYGRIQLINMPLLVMHGTDDKTVPYHQGVKLYEHALKPKQMVTFQGHNHNNIAPQAIAEHVFKFAKPYLTGCDPNEKL